MSIKLQKVDEIALVIKDEGFLIEREYRFHPVRKWQFDIALVGLKIAIEYEGGIWTNGGHNRGVIYADNCDKYNAAQLDGWIVLRYTAESIRKRGCKGVVDDIRERIQHTLTH